MPCDDINTTVLVLNLQFLIKTITWDASPVAYHDLSWVYKRGSLQLLHTLLWNLANQNKSPKSVVLDKRSSTLSNIGTLMGDIQN